MRNAICSDSSTLPNVSFMKRRARVFLQKRCNLHVKFKLFADPKGTKRYTDEKLQKGLVIFTVPRIIRVDLLTCHAVQPAYV